MEVDVVLCNHAEVADNKLYVTGGGINMAFVAPEPPHLISVALGTIIHVPYLLTNQPHQLRVSLVDEDGHPVVPFTADGVPALRPVELTVPFNIGRPPLISVGDEQTIALAANFVNLPLPHTGRYEFSIEVDGDQVRRMPIRVATPPG